MGETNSGGKPEEPTNDGPSWQSHVNALSLLISLFVGFVGLALLYIAAILGGGEKQLLITLLETIGSLLLVAVSVTILWELFGKRVFLNEVLNRVEESVSDSELVAEVRSLSNLMNIPPSIRKSGLQKVELPAPDGINWDPFFKSATKLDVFFTRGRTWRSNNSNRLKEFTSNDESQLRVFLPDPNDPVVVRELSRRHGDSASDEEIENSIRNAERFYRELGNEVSGSVEVYHVHQVPLFAFYRTNLKAIITLYSHRQKKVKVPTIHCHDSTRGSALYQYVAKEVDHMLESGNRVYPRHDQGD